MLDKLESALNATGIPFARFGWKNAPETENGVWGEDSAGHFYADNKMDAQTTEGTIDLFTKNADGSGKEKVQKALDSIECSWHLSSVQFEDDTGLLHYEWIFEV